MARQAPRVGTQFTRGQARRFVNVQRDAAQLFNGLGQPGPLVVGELAGTQMALVDAPNGAHDTNGQLCGPHFHGEHRHRQTLVHRHMLRNVDGQGRLAHGGTRRQHHQVARLQARGHAVKIIEASGHTCDVVRVLRHLFHAVQQVDHQRVHRLKALLHARAFFPDVENFLLGLVQNLCDRLAFGVERGGGNFIAGTDQLAQNGPLPHDFAIAANVAGTGHVLRQRVQVGQTAHLIGLAQALQMLEDSDDVGRTAAIDQGAHGRIHQSVLVAVKVAVVQQVTHPVPGTVVQQQAAQHAGLGFEGVRRDAQLGHFAVRRIVFF